MHHSLRGRKRRKLVMKKVISRMLVLEYKYFGKFILKYISYILENLFWKILCMFRKFCVWKFCLKKLIPKSSLEM